LVAYIELMTIAAPRKKRVLTEKPKTGIEMIVERIMDRETAKAWSEGVGVGVQGLGFRVEGEEKLRAQQGLADLALMMHAGQLKRTDLGQGHVIKTHLVDIVCVLDHHGDDQPPRGGEHYDEDGEWSIPLEETAVSNRSAVPEIAPEETDDATAKGHLHTGSRDWV